MRKHLDIVCHALPSWHGEYMKSTVQLMKELAGYHNVLYIDYAYSWKDVLFNSRKNKFIPVKRIVGIDKALEEVKLENGSVMHVLSLPPIIPFNWINNHTLLKFVQGVNSKIINARMKSAMKKLSMEKPMIVNAFNPFFGNHSFQNASHGATIYYCYDNISASVWASKHGTWLEQEFLKKVDAVVFTSEALQQSKDVEGLDSYVVNNGVDLTVFEQESAPQKKYEPSTEINIGYIGSIDDRLDYKLLEQVIHHFQDWNFHFIGRINSEKAERLKTMPNVRFYGAVDVKELPVLMSRFNAGIIPFVKNNFTKNIYPMKANEYLVLGLPVVMTDFAILNDLEEMVTVSENIDSFIQCLADEVKNDSNEKKNTRITKAMGNSWKNKALEFENILLHYV